MNGTWLRGPFRDDFITAMQGFCSFTINKPNRETAFGERCTYTLDSAEPRLRERPGLIPALEQGMPDAGRRVAARIRMRLPSSKWMDVRVRDDEGRRGTSEETTLRRANEVHGGRGHNRRDTLDNMLRRMGATVDLERSAPPWVTTLTHSSGKQAVPNGATGGSGYHAGKRRPGVARHHDTEVRCERRSTRQQHNQVTQRA